MKNKKRKIKRTSIRLAFEQMKGVALHKGW